jgi:hypothetical protein
MRSIDMRKTFVVAGLALLAGACAGTATTLKRELGPTPQQQIEELKAENAQCRERRAELERQLEALRRAAALEREAQPVR